MTATARNGAAPHRRLAPAVRTACLLLALACLAPPLAAQTDPILVSNVSQSASGAKKPDGTWRFAQEFRTGSASGGYDISEVILHFDDDSASGTSTVTVRGGTSANPADPNAVLATMTRDSPKRGSRGFTPASPVHLEPETSYWIVLEHSNTNGPPWQRAAISSGLDSESQAGWQIDQRHLETKRSSWNQNRQNPATALKFRLRGTAIVIPAVTVASDGDVTEGTAASFTLTRTGDTAAALEVGVTVSETGDMVAAGDEGTRTVTFGAGSATSTVTVPTQADSDSESDSTVTVAVADGDGYVAGTPSEAGVVVADDDEPLPMVTVTPVTTPVTEGTDAVFRLARTGDTAAPLRLSFSISETGDMCRGTNACNGAPASATIPAGQASTNLFVLTSDDSDHEADSVVTVTLAANAAYELGTDATAEVTVEDNDNAPPTDPTIDDTTPVVGQMLTADGITDADGLTGATFTWQWSRVSGSTVTRIPGATSKTYTVVAGDVGAKLKVEASFTDDDGTDETVESAETETVAWPMLSIGDKSVDEGDSGSTTLAFTVTLAPAAVAPVTVDWATADGTAEAGTDYTAGSGRLTFGVGDSTKTVSVTVTGDNVDEPNETFTVTLSSASGAAISDGTATGTIRDDDAEPMVTLVLSPASIPEAGSEADRTSTVTATLDHPSSEATTVTVSVAPVSPAVAGDYRLSSNRVLTIAAGQTTSTGTVTVTSVNNTVDAPDKTVTVSGTATNSQGVTAPDSVTLTIRDNDATPTVTLVLTPASITEAGGTSTVTATLDHPSSEATTVTVSASPVSPAVAGDYTLSGNLDLTIAAGATTSTGTVTITAVDNDVVAADKEVTVSATATNSQGVTNPDDVPLAITNDDEPGLSIADASVAEGDSGDTTLAFTVTLNPAAVSPVTVDWATADGTARAGTDYTAGNGRLTFGVGDSSKTVSVTVTGDDVDEPNETFTVTLSGASGATIEDAEATGTIRDDDDEPTVTLVLTPDSIDENGGTSTVTATLDHPSSEATTVTVSVAPVSPAVAGDYTLSGSQLTIAAGQTTSTGTVVTVTSVNNTVDAPDKTVTVSGTATNAQGVTAPDSVTLTIRDDDAMPKVTLVLTPASITEAGGTSTVTATLNHPSSEATTVTVSASPVSPAVAGDYTLSGSQLTIAAGATTSTGEVTITGVDNDVAAADKEVTVSATATNSQGVTAPDDVPLAITDNDEPGLSIANASVAEGDSGSTTMTFTVTLNPAALSPVTVDWATSDGTARAGTDYTAGNGSLTFNAGDSTKTVSVSVTGDDVDEPDKTFTVTLSNASGATIGDAEATGTIRDDDDEPTVTLVLTPASIPEAGSEADRTSTVTARLNHPSSEATTVTVSVAPVAPAVSGDYRLSSNRVLTIAAGQTDSTGTVTVTGVDNAVDAPHKTVTVSGTATNARGVTDPDAVTLTIRDNDATPTVTLVLTPASIPEAGGTSTVTARLDHPSSEATTVTVSAAPVSPAVSGDYRLIGSQLTIAAGQTDSTGEVTITAVDNDVVAADKEVTVSGTAANAQGITAPDDVPLAIRDDDVPGLSIGDASAAEGDSGSTTMTFTVMLNPVAVSPVTVDWATADGTARAGTDYTAGNGRLTFGAGEDRKTVSVTVTGDDVDEPNETLTVTLSSASGAAISDGTATGTITDDDGTPTVTLVLTPASIDENGGTSTVTARLDHPSSEATTVTVSVAPDSPAVAGDYRLSGSQLTIAAGSTTSTGTVTVTSVDNAVDAPHKTVTVSGTATNAQGVTDPDAVTLTITDDEVAVVTVAAETETVPEGDDAVFILTRTGVVSDELAVTFEVTGGDTVLTNKPPPTGVTFQANEDTARVTLATEDDDTDEPDAMLTLTLDDGGAYDPGTPSRAVVTVQDDEDPPTVSISSADDGSTKEEGAPFTFMVELSRQSAVPVTVQYTLTRTAVGDGDDAGGGATGMTTSFALGVVEGDVTFEPGETRKVVSLETDDERYSPRGDTLEITLQAGAGYVLDTSSPSSPTVMVEVRDDDGAPMVSIDVDESVTDVTEGGTLVFAVKLSHPSAVEITVDYTLKVTAEAENNHEGPATRTGTVTFEPDDTVREILVKTVNDGIVEQGGMVEVELTGSNVAALDSSRFATGMIQDDAALPVVTVAAVSGQIREGEEAEFELTRTGDLSEGLEVMLKVSEDGDMVPDTLEGVRDVRFEAGAEKLRFGVKIANDGSTESDSEVTVAVSPGGGYQVHPENNPLSSATVTVVDAGEVSVLAEGRRVGAASLLRRHVQRFSQLTSDVALGRLDGDPRTSTVDVDVGDGGVSANGDVAMALPSGWDGWASVRYSKLNGSADGSVWDVYAGADRLGADGRTAYGVLLGYEPGRVTAEGVRLEAGHVQLGLYGAHRLSETLTVDGAVGWGRGKGDLSLVEGAPVTASYRSERIAVRGDLTGDFGWGGEGLRVEPQIGLLYAEEGLDAFTDSTGSEAPEERLWLARLGLGPKVTWSLGEGGTMHGKLRVNLDAHNLDSDEGRTEEVSASLEVGHRWRIDKGSTLDLSAGFDGLGSGWFSSGTVGLRYEARF